MPISRESETRGNILKFPEKENILFKEALAKVEQGEAKAALESASCLAEQGFHHANTLIGYIYEHGGEGVPQDFDQAARHYQIAVDTVGAKHAWLGLARLYTDPRWARRDYGKAAECYFVVAEDAGDPIAWLNLGRLYSAGLGVVADKNIARSYFQKASKAGFVVADLELSRMLHESGRIFQSLCLRIKASVKAAIIAFYNKNDVRLSSR